MDGDKLILPSDTFEARDLVWKWENEGVPRAWDEIFMRSMQVTSCHYENDGHRRRSQAVINHVMTTYEMANYSKIRMRYLQLHSVPPGHEKRRVMAAGPPAGYKTRGYKKIIDPPPRSAGTPEPRQPGPDPGKLQKREILYRFKLRPGLFCYMISFL